MKIPDIHAVPINDWYPHLADNCWCMPTTDENGIIVHQSADCRELIERWTGAAVAEDKKWALVKIM